MGLERELGTWESSAKGSLHLHAFDNVFTHSLHAIAVYAWRHGYDSKSTIFSTPRSWVDERVYAPLGNRGDHRVAPQPRFSAADASIRSKGTRRESL